MKKKQQVDTPYLNSWADQEAKKQSAKDPDRSPAYAANRMGILIEGITLYGQETTE